MRGKDLEQTVLDTVWQNCNGGDKPTLASKLRDLNIDSLSFIAVIVGIEEALGVEFGEEQLNFYEYNSVGDLAAAARQLTDKRESKERTRA